MATRRGRVAETPVKENEAAEPEEVEEEPVEVEEDADTVEERTGEEDETVDSEYPALPDRSELIGGPDEGFDFLAQVHTDLKESGFVSNKGETKALIKYLHQMIFLDAFENGEHRISELGSLHTIVKPAETRTATFDMPNTPKGETYETAAKYQLKFKAFGSATKKLAAISEIDGWDPENFVEEAAE